MRPRKLNEPVQLTRINLILSVTTLPRRGFQLQHTPQGGGLGLLARETDTQVVALAAHLGELGLELPDAVDALLAVLAGGLIVALALDGGDWVNNIGIIR